MDLDLNNLTKRVATGEGLTTPEALQLISIVKGEKFDLQHELQEGMQDAIRCVRRIIKEGRSETAQIAASQFWIKMHNETIIADEGMIAISFDLMDPETSAAMQKDKEEVKADVKPT